MGAFWLDKRDSYLVSNTLGISQIARGCFGAEYSLSQTVYSGAGTDPKQTLLVAP